MGLSSHTISPNLTLLVIYHSGWMMLKDMQVHSKKVAFLVPRSRGLDFLKVGLTMGGRGTCCFLMILMAKSALTYGTKAHAGI